MEQATDYTDYTLAAPYFVGPGVDVSGLDSDPSLAPDYSPSEDLTNTLGDPKESSARSISEVPRDTIDDGSYSQVYVIDDETGEIFPEDKIDKDKLIREKYKLDNLTEEQIVAVKDIKDNKNPEPIKLVFKETFLPDGSEEIQYSVQTFIPVEIDEGGRIRFEMISELVTELVPPEETEKDTAPSATIDTIPSTDQTPLPIDSLEAPAVPVDNPDIPENTTPKPSLVDKHETQTGSEVLLRSASEAIPPYRPPSPDIDPSSGGDTGETTNYDDLIVSVEYRPAERTSYTVNIEEDDTTRTEVTRVTINSIIDGPLQDIEKITISEDANHAPQPVAYKPEQQNANPVSTRNSIEEPNEMTAEIQVDHANDTVPQALIEETESIFQAMQSTKIPTKATPLTMEHVGDERARLTPAPTIKSEEGGVATILTNDTPHTITEINSGVNSMDTVGTTEDTATKQPAVTKIETKTKDTQLAQPNKLVQESIQTQKSTKSEIMTPLRPHLESISTKPNAPETVRATQVHEMPAVKNEQPYIKQSIDYTQRPELTPGTRENPQHIANWTRLEVSNNRPQKITKPNKATTFDSLINSTNYQPPFNPDPLSDHQGDLSFQFTLPKRPKTPQQLRTQAASV